MKEFITVAVAFLVVVGLALYMYMSNQQHTIAVIENKKLEKIVHENHAELKRQIEEMRSHMRLMDSIYHK